MPSPLLVPSRAGSRRGTQRTAEERIVTRGVVCRGRRMLLIVCLLALVGISAEGQSSTGTIRGRVILTGNAPGNPFIRMGVDPKGAALNAGRRVIQESARVTADGSVANAFVRVDGAFPKTAVPAEPVVLDQRACFYRPR